MSVAAKLIAGALVLAAIGAPVLETWEALLLAACAFALVFGSIRPRGRPFAIAAAVVAAIVGIKLILPRANIAEAHNAFMVIRTGELLERELPGPVFKSWKAQLDARYPSDPGRDLDPYQWRQRGNAPETLFTDSADAIWRTSKYTRQVDAIKFSTPGEFRGGFSNESRNDGSQYLNLYNFWTGQMPREWMPFYVMYQLTRASVGSQLVWKGQAFWEHGDTGFDEIVHPTIAARRIEASDAGKRVYVAFFPGPTRDIYFELAPSLRLRLAAWTAAILSFIGAVTVIMLTVRLRWGLYLRALTLFSTGYLTMAILSPANGGYLGKTYGPFRGGDDGMLHDGYGRAMAMLAGRGDIVEALKGAEPVYWFTPGMRYFRMLEKLIFGDTNHLHALILACLPVVLFYLVRDLAGSRWAWIVTVMFLVMPVGNLSFLQYIAYASEGYGEAVAAVLFLLGVTLIRRAQTAWGGTSTSLTVAWLAGASLAAAMFIRPNLALAVIWLGAAFAWASRRRADWRMVAALAFGLGLALWMPLHNWFYAREFYLISKAGSTVSLPVGVGDYGSALRDVVRGRFHTGATAIVRKQLSGWLGGPGFLGVNALMLAWITHAMRLFALALTGWVAIRWLAGSLTEDADLGVIAVAALCAHVPMLFIYSTVERYAVVAWDLSLVVLIGWLARRVCAVHLARDSRKALSYAR